MRAAPTAPAAAPAVADEEFDTPAAVAAPAPVAEAAPAAPVATPPAGGTQRAEDILAMIRNRQKT